MHAPVCKNCLQALESERRRASEAAKAAAAALAEQQARLQQVEREVKEAARKLADERVQFLGLICVLLGGCLCAIVLAWSVQIVFQARMQAHLHLHLVPAPHHKSI